MTLKLSPIKISKSPKEYATQIVKDLRTKFGSGNNLMALQKELEKLSLKLGESIQVEFTINITKKK